MKKKKIADRSIRIAKRLFLQSHNKKNPLHFALLWKKNTLISVGQNETEKTSAKAFYFAKRFNTPNKIKYPYIHAEVDAISKVWGKTFINESFSIVSLRFTKDGKLNNAKPCKDCQSVIRSAGIGSVYWSNNIGKIEYGKVLY